MFLRNALSTNSEFKPLLDATPPGKKEYKILIVRLEEKFGGTQRLLNHHLALLQKLKVVHTGDLHAAEQLLDVAKGYRACLVQAGLDKSETHVQFSMIKAKLSSSLRHKYMDYCHLKGYNHFSKSKDLA